MNFCAIDFETATGYRNSACAVAIITVTDGQISDEYYRLNIPLNHHNALSDALGCAGLFLQHHK